MSAAGCFKAPATSGVPADGGVTTPVPAVTVAATASDAATALSAPRTTDAAIALSNLDSQIRSTEAMLRRSPGDPGLSRRLVDMLITRGQFRGTIADYERADGIADALVKAHPDNADAHMARAATLGTFHLFARSIREAELAGQMNAPHASVEHLRATAFIAEGRFDEADALGLWRDPESLDSTELASAAVLAGERGLTAESEALFEKARGAYHDVSPFPVAWVDFQRGWLLERKGDRVRAKAYFAEAHAVLAPFAHAAVHLASMVTPDESRLLLEPLLGHSDDPEVDASYGDALRRLGHPDDAKPFVARARARYEELLSKHPEAFADHAAVFFLGLGQDPTRAFQLAKRNAESRETEAALDLLVDAALAAGKHEDACAAATRGQGLRYATPAFRARTQSMHDECAPKSAPVGSP